MIRLIGPGGAGKSTIGALLAQRLEVPFLDLDRHFASRFGDISEFIGRHGYDAYARENVEAYCSVCRDAVRPGVVALSSGFMTYAHDTHTEYRRIRREIEECAQTLALLPSLTRELCVAETVRRQVARPFGRSPEREEAVIRARFEIYAALPVRKVETMRPAAVIVDEILAALMTIDVAEESTTAIAEYALLPIAFRVDQVLDVTTRGDGRFALSARKLESPYVKDYDGSKVRDRCIGHVVSMFRIGTVHGSRGGPPSRWGYHCVQHSGVDDVGRPS